MSHAVPMATAQDRSPHRLIAASTILLQLLAFLPYLLAGLIAPSAAVLALRALWVALSVLAVVTYRVGPRRSLLVPPVTFAVGAGMLALGGTFWGWEG